MSIRSQLLANISQSLQGLTVSTSQELPFECGDKPCYIRNMRRVYLDTEIINRNALIATLNAGDVIQTEVEVVGYLALDAKNLPQDHDLVIERLLKSRLSIPNQFRQDCEITHEIDSDRLVYTLRYLFQTINSGDQ